MPPPRFSRENMSIIEAKGIFHSYNGKDTVLNGVDLSVERENSFLYSAHRAAEKQLCFP